MWARYESGAIIDWTLASASLLNPCTLVLTQSYLPELGVGSAVLIPIA